MGPWNGNDTDPTGNFPILGPLQNDMKEIYRLFNSEADVTFCLEQLINQLDLTNTDSFLRSLLELEVNKYGFNAQVATIEKELSSLEFLSYVGAKRPIIDLAFRETNHGGSTHRIQFMMIAIWRETHPEKIKEKACDIYAAMSNAVSPGAVPDSNGKYSFEQVAWNHYFDVDPVAIWVNNACRPDYFCGTFIAKRFPKLAKVAL